MNTVFNPSRGSEIAKNSLSFGYVTRVKSLPIPDETMKNVVVFVEDDGRFYRCIEIPTEEASYIWEAQTAGAHRTYLIPVEKLPTSVLTESQKEHPSYNNCFDAVISAINEIAVGLKRFGVYVEALCYKRSTDTVYQSGTTYYIWNDEYNRQNYVVTTDTTAKADKVYYLLDSTGIYFPYTFPEGAELDPSKTWLEATKPQFITDPDAVTGQPIIKNVYIRTKDPETVDLTDIKAKYDEIVIILNTNKAGLIASLEADSLFQTCLKINKAIDEVNPFSGPYDQLLNRMKTIELAYKKYRTFLGTVSEITLGTYVSTEDLRDAILTIKNAAAAAIQ